MKKNIWIDGYEANVPQRLGSGQVAVELLKHMELVDQANSYTVLLPNPPLADLPKPRQDWRYRILKPKQLWTRIALPLAIFTGLKKPDVFFSPTHYIPRFSSVKRVGMVFDLSYLHFPQLLPKADLYKLTNWTKYSILNAEKIITISEISKQDIVKNYGISESKVVVAYPGFNEQVFKQVTESKQIKKITGKYKISGRYIIYVGTIQPRKNLIKLIEALSKTQGINLVIVGKTTGEGRQGWQFEETMVAPKKFGVEDRVVFTGYAPTEDLPALLSGAEAYILPSLWEGFGIPVVEAMACGTPVLVSNVSSLPEVVGKAGLTFDPSSVEQISQAIEKIISDQALRKKLSLAGLEQAKKYSWDKMAKQVIEVLEKI